MKGLMNRNILVGLIIVVTLLFIGCTVVYREPHPHGTTHYVIHSDIEWVVWEYYDWDYDLVVQLHSLNYTPDEVALILFLAYHSHSHPMTIVKWRQVNVSWMDITRVHLKLEPSVFFVSITPEVKIGPPYGRAYGYYRKSPQKIVLTYSEMINLVHLKVTCEAFDIPAAKVIKLREQGKTFDQIVQKQVQVGKGIKTRKGRIIKRQYYQKKKPDISKPGKPSKKDQPDKTRDKPEKPDKSKDKPDKSKDKPDKGKGKNKGKSYGKGK